LNWLQINSITDWENLLEESKNSSDEVVAIFKHSTRCPISSMVKIRVENSWSKANPNVPIYIVDLIRYRDLSNQIASSLNVVHESPQLILLKKGEQIYNASHTGIDSKAVASYI